MKKPTIARVVIFYPAIHDQQSRNNGAEEIPAIIVSLSDPESGFVNLRVLQDGANVPWRTSVPHKSKAKKGDSYWDWPEITGSESKLPKDVEAKIRKIVEESDDDIADHVKDVVAEKVSELWKEHMEPLRQELTNLVDQAKGEITEEMKALQESVDGGAKDTPVPGKTTEEKTPQNTGKTEKSKPVGDNK